ncbi:MAG: universal stress protein [Pyrinomonadaceae bacterium]
MSEKFKILIAYDGSHFAEAALDDLKSAGLFDENVEAIVFSVAEVWLPPMNDSEKPQFMTDDLKKSYEENLGELNKTKASVSKAADRLKKMFPGWNISFDATYGSAAWEILAKADEIKADLIVVGARGETNLDRILLGSVSQRVVTEAKCSVRVARGKIQVDDAPTRIIFGYDGSHGADEAVKKITGRNWRKGSEARVVIVEDNALIRSSLNIEEEKINQIGAEIVKKLNFENLSAELIVREGNPKQILVEEAENRGADCIFVGAAKFDDFLTKYLLGSVSTAIVTRAHCSVEIVRP